MAFHFSVKKCKIKLMCIRVFLILLTWATISTCQDIFLVVSDFNQNTYYCITNSSFALSWIDDTNTGSVQQASTFLPKLPQNDFDWGISFQDREKQYVQAPWTLRKSLSGVLHIPKIILDRRWEKMKVYRTNDSFNRILSLEENFIVPFSIQFQKNAHIFLCDGRDVYEMSNCYWLSLQVSKTTLRQCQQKFISVLDDSKCEILTEKPHPAPSNNRKWTHFELVKNENNLTLSQINIPTNVHQKEEILSFSAKDGAIDVKKMIVYSGNESVLWKIHELEYIYTEEESDNVQLGPVVSVANNSICVSMFVMMCYLCQLKLTLVSANDSIVKWGERIFRPQMEWTEITFYLDDVNTNQVLLLVSTINVHQFIGFWAVDEVRQCQKKEVRMINSTKKLNCQLLSTYQSLISSEETTDNSSVSKCTEDTIGRHCIPCGWIFQKTCDRQKICESYKGQTKCICSAGYLSNNKSRCSFRCPVGQFGHGCRKTCGKCQQPCDPVDGTCKGCVGGYSGIRCDIPPATIFERPPVVKDLTYTEVTIEITDFSVIDNIESDPPKVYEIQYKEVEAKNWVTHGSQYTFGMNLTTKIENLEPGVQYFLRCIITTNSGIKFADERRVPTVMFSTKCDAIKEENIEVKPQSTSVEVLFINDKPYTCKFTKYTISIPNVRKATRTNGTTVHFEGLTPSTDYKIILKNELGQIEKLFKTYQNQYDLGITWTMTNDLVLEWKPPDRTSLRYFNISVTPQVKTLDKKITSPKVLRFTSIIFPFKVDAKDLLPSTPYTIEAKANDDDAPLVVEDTSPPAIPSIDSTHKISATSQTITLEISAVKLRSPNLYQLLVLVLDEDAEVQPQLRRLKEDLQLNLSKFRIVYDCILQKMGVVRLTIGDESESSKCKKKPNPPLNPGTTYNVTILLISTFKNKSRYKMYSFTSRTTQRKVIRSYIPVVVPTVVVVLGIIFFAFLGIYLHNIRKRKLRQNIPYYSKFHRFAQEDPTVTFDQIIHSKVVEVENFQNYVKNSIGSNDLRDQYSMVTNNLNNTIYEEIDVNLCIDYIDMYYTNDKIAKAYIITKVPTARNVTDFWRMVWEESVQNIVLLDNIFNAKKKTKNYWPAKNNKLQCQNISIQTHLIEFFADYEIRNFILTRNEEIRQIRQLRFISWPDNGNLHPLRLVPFFKTLSQIPLCSKSPILIHCRNGVEETGFALLCDMCLKMAHHDGVVDVLRNLQRLSDYIPKLMIRTVEQYLTVHLVILETLSAVDTSIRCQAYEKTLLNDKEVKKQIRLLKSTQWLDQILETTKKKNDGDDYFWVIRPEVGGQISLAASRENLRNSTLAKTLKSWTVDGFRCPGRFVVTKQPTPDTLGDFWKLVEEKNISIIISLNMTNSLNYAGSDLLAACSQACTFWPDEEHPFINPAESVSIKYKHDKNFGCYDGVTVHLHLDGKTKYKTINIISMRNWQAKANYPPNVSDFVSFCIESNAFSKKSSKVLVACSDGIRACGMYLAMLYNIEKMKVEGVCDVYSAVRNLRYHRLQFVDDEGQFRFLCDATADYIKNIYFEETRKRKNIHMMY